MFQGQGSRWGSRSGFVKWVGVGSGFPNWSWVFGLRLGPSFGIWVRVGFWDEGWGRDVGRGLKSSYRFRVRFLGPG